MCEFLYFSQFSHTGHKSQSGVCSSVPRGSRERMCGVGSLSVCQSVLSQRLQCLDFIIHPFNTLGEGGPLLCQVLSLVLGYK